MCIWIERFNLKISKSENVKMKWANAKFETNVKIYSKDHVEDKMFK
jgi:hypothetical protein